MRIWDTSYTIYSLYSKLVWKDTMINTSRLRIKLTLQAHARCPESHMAQAITCLISYLVHKQHICRLQIELQQLTAFISVIRWQVKCYKLRNSEPHSLTDQHPRTHLVTCLQRTRVRCNDTCCWALGAGDPTGTTTQSSRVRNSLGSGTVLPTPFVLQSPKSRKSRTQPAIMY